MHLGSHDLAETSFCRYFAHALFIVKTSLFQEIDSLVLASHTLSCVFLCYQPSSPLLLLQLPTNLWHHLCRIFATIETVQARYQGDRKPALFPVELPPQIFLSTTTTFFPDPIKQSAADRPATPAPTINTSVFMLPHTGSLIGSLIPNKVVNHQIL
jgi:hypothetical protein